MSASFGGSSKEEGPWESDRGGRKRRHLRMGSITNHQVCRDLTFHFTRSVTGGNKHFDHFDTHVLKTYDARVAP